MSHLPPVRRVVTGHNSDGRAIISIDSVAPAVFPLKAVSGTYFHEIWNTSASPAVIDNGPDPTLRALQLHPAPQGSLIRVVDIPPDSTQNALSEAQAAAAFAEIGAAHAGTGHAHAKHRLMHRTQTVDYGIVLIGEIWLVVDEAEVKLKAGDIVIQRGTNHAWSNRTEETARMIFILLDGRFAPEIKAER